MSELRGALLVDGELRPGTITFGERIESIELEDAASAVDLPVVAPGLIDLHVHGYGGAAADDDLAGMARALARQGTTAFLPTLFPGQPAALGARAAAAWEAARALEAGRAEHEEAHAAPLGLHLEGPFVNPLSAGALPKDGLAEPSVDALHAILGPATGDGRGVRTMTVAPELPGAAALIEELERLGVRVSLGHSLATAADARAASRAGARGVTHLFNAMGKLHHREVGLLGFALSDDALCAELIGDLVHVGEDAVQLALRARGPEGLALISDALAGAGTGCDVFHSHGHTCRVTDGAIWIDDETAEGGRRLTGAAATQLEALRRLVVRGVVALPDALRMASETPARALGLEGERGTLAVGARADLIELAPDLALRRVVLGGRSFAASVPGSGDSVR